MPGATSIVCNGTFEGVGLDVLAQRFGSELTGTKAPNPEVFPLLIKLLDAHDRLSVQVHPDAEAAALLGSQPKHEMWYILDAAPDATLWAGLHPGSDLDHLTEADLVAWHPNVGDIFDIRPGLVHTIGPGNLIYEVQQPSDTTYRVSDWGRGRETHQAQARQAIHPKLTAQAIHPQGVARRDLSMCLSTPDFAFATLKLHRDRALYTTALSFMVLFCASGKATLEHNGPHPITLLPGDLVLVPPSQRFVLHPIHPAQLLISTL